MKNDELIVPIRTRGEIRLREQEGAHDLSSTVILTKGAIRARGVSPEEWPRRVGQPIAIQEMIENLREQSRELPLSIVVYGWGGKQAEDFLAKLGPYLWPQDPVVLIPLKGIALTALTTAPPGAVLLNMNRPSHRRMYENGNLVGDIVFFGESQDWEASEVQRWRDSAQAVIVKEGASRAESILRVARESNQFVYLWSGESLRLSS